MRAFARLSLDFSDRDVPLHDGPCEHLYRCQKPWADDCFVQAGEGGVVFGNKGSYTTAFFEAFPKSPDTFLRGEGKTVEEAEEDCWKEWLKVSNCPSPTGNHEYETRGYRNGGGICKHCGMFSSKVFTGEELGQFCVVCGVGTTYSLDDEDKENEKWYCKEHHDHNMSYWARRDRLMMQGLRKEISEEEYSRQYEALRAEQEQKENKM